MKTNIAIADYHRIFRKKLAGYFQRDSDIQIDFEVSNGNDLMQKFCCGGLVLLLLEVIFGKV